MDPDEVSSEEEEEQEWGAGASSGFVQPGSDDDDDDDDEGDPDEVACPNQDDEEEEEEAAAANPGGAGDDDDDLPAEEEEEEDDEDDDPPPSKAATKSTLTSFFAAKPKAPAPAANQASTSKPPAAKPAMSTSKAAAAYKPNKSKPKDAPPPKPAAASKPKPKAKTFTPHSDSDDEGPLGLVPPQNPGVPLRAPDAIAEFEQHRAAASRDAPAGATAAAEPAASVHPSALEFDYFMKNEKVNKLWLVNPEAFVSAPDLGNADLLRFTMEDLAIPSKRDRLAMQEALCDKEGTKVVSTTVIAELKTDGSGSGTGPGMSPVMMAVPYEPDFGEAELEDLRAKQEKAKPGSGERKLVGLLALDPELAKRAYAINKCPLPAVYNPNTNSSNKYKVPSKLEDLAKVDDNFTYIGPVEKPKRAPKRGAGEERPSGAKRPAAENGREEMDARHRADVAYARAGDLAGLTEFNGREIGLQNCKAWSLTCDEDDMYSLFQTTPGKWVLFRGKF